MIKKLLIVPLLLVVSVYVHAQNNFRPGYIITSKNDSIVGLIDLKTDKANSRICSFKRAEKEPVTKYVPSEIKRYRFIDEGKYYVSREVETDGELRNVFLEFLVRGEVNLYLYVNSNGVRTFFFENEAGKLISVSKNTENSNSKQNYIGALKYLFDDVDNSISESKVKLNSEALISLTNDHNNMHGLNSEVFDSDWNRNKFKWKFSVYGGVEYVKYFSRDPNEWLKSSTCPVVGVQAKMYDSRSSGSVFLVTDLSFSKIDTENYVASIHKTEEHTLGAIMSNFRCGVGYVYPKGVIRPAVDAGVSGSFLFKRYDRAYFTSIDEDIPPRLYEGVHMPKSFFFGTYGGVGFDFAFKNESSIFFRVSYVGFVAGHDTLHGTQFKLGYTF